jgi:hypothetical protein
MVSSKNSAVILNISGDLDSESVLQMPKRRKSPTPNGVGLFQAVLNLMYISAKISKRLKVKILRVATVFLCFVMQE